MLLALDNAAASPAKQCSRKRAAHLNTACNHRRFGASFHSFAAAMLDAPGLASAVRGGGSGRLDTLPTPACPCLPTPARNVSPRATLVQTLGKGIWAKRNLTGDFLRPSLYGAAAVGSSELATHAGVVTGGRGFHRRQEPKNHAPPPPPPESRDLRGRQGVIELWRLRLSLLPSTGDHQPSPHFSRALRLLPTHEQHSCELGAGAE